VKLEITVPSEAVKSAFWFEVGAFKDASCTGLSPMLAAGVPEGATTRVAFKRDDASSPRVGDLPRGPFAFGAVAKDEECGILATGCVEVDLADSDTVTVAMEPTENATGKCGVGSSCQAARCVPSNNNNDPNVGAGCSLELLGAGPLANPVGGGGTMVSAPAVAATPTGFVIVYREVDPNGAVARVTVLPVDFGGGALSPARPQLSGRCATSQETDGVGLVMSAADGAKGQIVLARSACGAKPGLEVLSFTTSPEVAIDTNFRTTDSDNVSKILLSGGHVAAARTTGDIIAYVTDGQSAMATVTPGVGVQIPRGTFGFQGGATGSWIASSDRVLAVLSSGNGGGGADAGADSGSSDSEPTLSLLMAPVGTALDAFVAATGKPRPPVTFPGEWGAVAARGTRVITLSDGTGPGRSATYRTWDIDRTEPAETSGFSVDDSAKITAGDVVIVGDRAYFAALTAGSVSLHVYSNASTTPVPLREVIFSKVPRIPTVSTIRDGRVAIAATEGSEKAPGRVAVAWTSATVLNPNDATGGYAVFGCTP